MNKDRMMGLAPLEPEFKTLQEKNCPEKFQKFSKK